MVRDFRAKLNRLYLVSRRLVEEILSGSYRSVFRGPGVFRCEGIQSPG